MPVVCRVLGPCLGQTGEEDQLFTDCGDTEALRGVCLRAVGFSPGFVARFPHVLFQKTTKKDKYESRLKGFSPKNGSFSGSARFLKAAATWAVGFGSTPCGRFVLGVEVGVGSCFKKLPTETFLLGREHRPGSSRLGRRPGGSALPRGT